MAAARLPGASRAASLTTATMSPSMSTTPTTTHSWFDSSQLYSFEHISLQDPEIVFDSLEIEPSTEEIIAELGQCIGEYFNTADKASFLEQIEGMLIKGRSLVLEQLIESSLGIIIIISTSLLFFLFRAKE